MDAWEKGVRSVISIASLNEALAAILHEWDDRGYKNSQNIYHASILLMACSYFNQNSGLPLLARRDRTLGEIVRGLVGRGENSRPGKGFQDT